MMRFSVAAALFLAAAGSAMAQDSEIKWTQTINVPKGQHMPRDRADILGIELGDTYAEARAKLEKLAGEGIQPKAASGDLAKRMTSRLDGQRAVQPLQEEKRIYQFRTPGASSPVTASFVQKIELVREMASETGKKYTDRISVLLSAPSSGHQVIGVTRSITYGADGDQPLISETVARLKAKMQFAPQMIQFGGTKYRFQFDNGKPFAPPNPTETSCGRAGYSVVDEVHVKTINESGNCDAYLEMSAQTGISRDHASILYFVLSDNDRAKANLTADFAFLSDYVRSVQEKTRGAPPKL